MKTLTLFACVLFTALQLHAQVTTISGTVTDDSNAPLPGVNVVIKGTANGTQTDFNGRYTIEAEIGNILVFTYVGFEKKTRKITSENHNKPLHITMTPNKAELNEIIVVADQIETETKSYAIANVIRGKASGLKVKGYNQSIYYPHPPKNTESYAKIDENTFKSVQTSPLSTFSIDVDKASYSNLRRFINNGQEVPKDAVKIEEMINYFDYDLPQPKGNKPFSITSEMAQSPWNVNTKLMRIGLKGKEISLDEVSNSNLVFLLDVSGSMGQANKLPLLKSALRVLVDKLREDDKVSIVVYAGAAGLVLPPTSGVEKSTILNAINKLNAGGSTAGGAGIKLAYKVAEENFIDGGNNRIILATDGDFNVGASSDSAMETLIEEKRETGIFLTCLGFGMGNYQDSKMETLADKGNGNHFYIDTQQEAHKVLGKEFFGTIYTIAKDVKIQVEFNPSKVQAYRLIGYEKRLLNDEDFNDDKKDAGEIGSGHTITALYEVIPTGVKSKYLKDIDKLKYTETTPKTTSDEIATIKFRYKAPDGNTSKLITKTVNDGKQSIEDVSTDFRFATAVALFGMQLRDSEFITSKSKNDVLSLAESSKGKDDDGYRAEFVRLVKSYTAL